MKNMTAMNAKRKQAGFTIIELVVVILLLGILTATALPRFMDVTDEAHEAVVDAVAGGFATGTALFRAQWVAEGQPLDADVSEYNVRASSTGYPIGDATPSTIATATGTNLCADVYAKILQTGSPQVHTITGVPTGVVFLSTDTGPLREGKIEAAAATAAAATTFPGDIIPALDQLATPADTEECIYYYVGQYRSGAAATADQRVIPTITYNFVNGDVTRGTHTFLTAP